MESLKGDSAFQRIDGYHLTFPKMKVPVTGSTPIVLQGLHLVSASLRLGMHGFCNENCLKPVLVRIPAKWVIDQTVGDRGKMSKFSDESFSVGYE